jgi:PAS domain S-box-containing protein
MFRKIFQYSTDAISIASRADGRYLDVNDEWLAALGFRREEVIGKDPFTLGIWADPHDFTLFVSELLLKNEVRNRSTKFRARDGSIVHGLLSAVILETGGTQVALGVVNVLSAEKNVPE